MNLNPVIGSWIPEITAWRRHLHQYPEIGFTEVKTSAFVVEKLTSWGIPVKTGLAKTGVVGLIENGAGPVVGLRCDMDALPIHELNTFEHKSKHDGIMHACGHDGHTAMLLAAGRYLNQTRNFRGTVKLIFQPAEEILGGGEEMVKDGVLSNPDVDRVFGLHNWPSMPLGRIAVSPGAVMASADQFDLFITGKGTHAAYPELGNNPVVLASLVPAAFNAIARRRSVNRNNRVVISVTSVHTGDAYNVIPETAHLRGTLRTLDMGVRKKVLDDIAKTLRSLARKTRGTFNLRYLPVKIPVTCNDASAVEFSKKACERVYPKRAIGPVDHPTMGTEDFAYMLQVKRGAYLWMGSKDPSGPQKFLHNPYYDFNDKALVLGASIWTALAEEYLKQ